MSANVITVSPARELRVLQLRMRVPQSAEACFKGRGGYAIRQIVVLGPGRYDGWM